MYCTEIPKFLVLILILYCSTLYVYDNKEIDYLRTYKSLLQCFLNWETPNGIFFDGNHV